MADPARKQPDPVRQHAESEPAAQRLRADNDPRHDPRVDHRRIIEQHSGGVGNGVIIAGVALALAVIAYLMFAPGPEATTPTEPPAVTAPESTAPSTDPATPAPDAMAPAAPDATAPAAPAQPAPAN